MLGHYFKLLIWIFLGLSSMLPELAESSPTELLVGAATSLRLVSRELGLGFEQQNPKVKIVWQFSASGQIQQQIEQGAPYDVFIGASRKAIEPLLKSDRVLAESVRSIAGNVLVLLAAHGKKQPKQLSDLKDADFKRIAIGEPRIVPVGMYAEQWLQRKNLWAMLQQRLIPVSGARQVLHLLETGNADLGFAYKTDALSATKLVIVLEADAQQHEPIVYQLAVVKKSKQLNLAKKFAAFIESPAARHIFDKSGFILPP